MSLRQRKTEANAENDSSITKPSESKVAKKSEKGQYPSEEVVRYRILTGCGIITFIFVAALAAATFLLYTRLGFGKDFPVQEISSQAPMIAADRLQIAGMLQLSLTDSITSIVRM
jgi:hypothetical protein